MVKTLYDVSVKYLRTEFFSSSIAEFIHFLGIIHQSSFAYNSQQSGVAEKIHRRILNIV